MNKILKIPIEKFILICASFIFTDYNYSVIAPKRIIPLKP